MLSVERHIAYLVTRHDCVIMPGLGAFISLYHPAAYDEESGRFTPPRRITGFNPDINHNDAMIAASIARREHLAYDRAVDLLNSEIESWRSQLEASGSIAIDGVGVLRKDAEGSTIFEPIASTASASNLGFQGLPELKLRVDEASVAPANAPTRSSLRRISSSVVSAAASIAIIITLLATIFTATLSPDSPLYYASLFPSPQGADESSKVEAVANRPIEVAHNAELRLAMVSPEEGTVAVKPKTAAPAIPAAPAAKVESPIAATAGNYYLIVASLASQTEVDRFIAAQPADKRSQLNVLRGSGRMRVYIASGATFDEANSARHLDDNPRLYPDAWVYQAK